MTDSKVRRVADSLLAVIAENVAVADDTTIPGVRLKVGPIKAALIAALTDREAIRREGYNAGVEAAAKPLCWYKPTGHPQDSEDALWIAHGIGGRYSIQPDDGNFIVWLADDEFTFRTGKTEDDCKAIAEAHWQQAFRCALAKQGEAQP